MPIERKIATNNLSKWLNLVTLVAMLWQKSNQGGKKFNFHAVWQCQKVAWTKTKTNYRHYAEIKHFWLDFFKSHEYFKPIRVLYFMVVPDVF